MLLMPVVLEAQLAPMPLVVVVQRVVPVPPVRNLLEGQDQVAAAELQMLRLLAAVAARGVLVAEEAGVVVGLLTALTLVLVALAVKVMHEFTVGKGIIWATQK
jgi:hypothetical protein